MAGDRLQASGNQERETKIKDSKDMRARVLQANAAGLDELPEGWFSPGDIAAYTKLYESTPVAGSTAELGVWQGRSICSVSQVIRRQRLCVHAVDTFQGTGGESDLVHDCQGRLREVFESNLARFGIREYVRVHVGSTLSIAEAFEDASLDLVFIDSDHRYEQVAADIRAWLPKVKPAGLLSGHDYRRPWRHLWGHDRSGVKRAVDEILGKKGVIVSSGSSVWSYRLAA